jgi:ABC-2 type transport system permease protein
MRQILAIAWKDIYSTFSDRNLVIIMIATPLAIATIVGLAFGNLSSGDMPVSDIPVAIVNLDEGSGGQNFGAIFTSTFVPPAENGEAENTAQQPSCDAAESSSDQSVNQTSLYDLTDAVALDSVEAARAGVDNGDYTAAIIIPSDFTSKILYGPADPIEPTSIEVYANSGRPVPAAIIRSISEGIANQIASGNIAAAATLETVGEQYGLLQIASVATNQSFVSNLACAFTPAFNTLSIEQQTVAGQQTNSAGVLLVTFGSAQAMFFAMFSGQAGVLSVFEERRQWTLQRLVIAPLTRMNILLGKLLGTFVTCLFQLMALAVALTIVGSILSGRLTFIWGDNLLAIFLVMVAASAAVTGLGVLMAGIAKTPEQSATYAQLLNIVLALLGGAFGLQLPQTFARFSMIFWGADAFRKLSLGQGDIALNVLVLLAHGVVLFVVGWWMFNRRLDI